MRIGLKKLIFCTSATPGMLPANAMPATTNTQTVIITNCFDARMKAPL
jgi:hypothetical protein